MSKVWLVTTVGIDLKLLPKFILYYKTLGIPNFIIVTQASYKASSILKTSEKILSKAKIPNLVHDIWIGEFSEILRISNERRLIEQNCSYDDWIVYADIDEFQEYPGGFFNTILNFENKKKNFIEGRIIDRISDNGYLIKYNSYASLEMQYPLEGQITRKLLKAWDKKIVAAKAFKNVGGGHHVFLKYHPFNGWVNCPYKRRLNRNSRNIKIHHFKWDYTVLCRMKKELEYSCSSLQPWKNEISRFINYYKKYGCINIRDKRFRIKRVISMLNI